MGNNFLQVDFTITILESIKFRGQIYALLNEVVAKRMVKKQQMQWTHEGAHYLLQTRTAVLNGDLQSTFERWYPNLKIVEVSMEQEVSEMEIAA